MTSEQAENTMAFRIIREPKGGPDAVLAGPFSREETLVRVGNTLSVMGYTARLILYDKERINGLPPTLEPALFKVTVLLADNGDDAELPVTVLPENTEAGDIVRIALQSIAVSL